MEKVQKTLMKELFAVIEKNDKTQIEGFCKILKLPDAIDTWDYITKSNFPSMVLNQLKKRLKINLYIFILF